MANYPEERPSVWERFTDWVSRNKEALLLTATGLALSEGVNLTNVIPNDIVRSTAEDIWGEKAFFEKPVFDLWAGKEGTEDEFGFKFNKFWGDNIIVPVEPTFDITNDAVDKELAASISSYNGTETKAQEFADDIWRAIFTKPANWGDLEGAALSEARAEAVDSIRSANNQFTFEKALGSLNAGVLGDIVESHPEAVGLLKGDITQAGLDKLLEALDLTDKQMERIKAQDGGVAPSVDTQLDKLGVLITKD